MSAVVSWLYPAASSPGRRPPAEDRFSGSLARSGDSGKVFVILRMTLAELTELLLRLSTGADSTPGFLGAVTLIAASLTGSGRLDTTTGSGFFLGLNPRDKKTLTTLRLIPTVRDTFAKAGIKMENFDALPNYWNSPVHNIRKRTDRTRSCDSCHVERSGFLKKETLPENGSRANEGLIMAPKPINR